MSFYSEIVNRILTNDIQTKAELHRAKVMLCSQFHISDVPPDSDIIAHLPADLSSKQHDRVVALLRKKPMRTISGVAIVAVMTSPAPCPHGKCLPCPGGTAWETPQSYTGHEPAAMRAQFHGYDPFLQTKARIGQLQAIGHPVDKIDLIVMGGTFTSRTPWYQTWFIKRCYDALNGKDSQTVEEAQRCNETATHRCIGLTIETRPDWLRLQHIDQILHLGATRVELGIQTVYDDLLYLMSRGHTIMDSKDATRLAKNCGLKVCYHMMPGLPGSDETRDRKALQTIVEDDDFKPDMVKIYPTLTIEGTELYTMWERGLYTPLTTEEAVHRISQWKTLVPEWIRIQRIQRDIPASFIESGVTKSNLRQLVEEELQHQGYRCRCIRCREIGHKSLRETLEVHEEDISLECLHYQASGSEELFLSLVDRKHDALLGYLRLRDIHTTPRWELQQNPCMIIRELKVVGQELSLGKRDKNGWQHKGYGKELLQEAERLCSEEFDKRYLYVLSGTGVKEYYRKAGFQDVGVYLVKHLRG
jgi:elongator complex protein 3